MEESKHLANSRLFQGLDEDGLSALLQIAEMQMFDEGEVIFREGEPGHELYVVMDGEVRISLQLAGGGEEALAILGTGNSFGEISLVEDAGALRSASAIVHKDCTVLRLSKVEVQELLERDHDIGYIVLQNLLSELAAHLRTANEKLVFLTTTGRF